MKNIICALAFSTAVMSCSRDNNDSDTSTLNNLLPTKITASENGDTYTVDFKYNSDKIAELNSKYGSETSKLTFEYTGDYITKISTTDGEDSSTNLLKYDGSKLVSTSFIGYENNGEYTTTINTAFTYNSNGTVAAKRTRNTKKKSDPSYNYTATDDLLYTLVNGQITKYTETSSNGYTLTKTYSYDDKNSVFKNIKGFAQLVFDNEDLGDVFSMTQNNYTMISNTNTNSNNSYSFTSKFVNDYNSFGYPTKMTETFSGTNGATNISTYTITYNK